MLLMIDNYDSFTYTLVQYFQALGQEVLVKRNDEVSLSEVAKLNPQRIVISPGPKSPNEAGISMEVILQFYKTRPILGVCLGHQAIAQAFGAEVVRANEVMHGKTSLLNHNNKGLFKGLTDPMEVTRYHSLLVNESSLPEQLQATAWVEQSRELMALAHKNEPLVGVQFHPESVLTQDGQKLLANFLDY